MEVFFGANKVEIENQRWWDKLSLEDVGRHVKPTFLLLDCFRRNEKDPMREEREYHVRCSTLLFRCFCQETDFSFVVCDSFHGN